MVVHVVQLEPLDEFRGPEAATLDNITSSSCRIHSNSRL